MFILGNPSWRDHISLILHCARQYRSGGNYRHTVKASIPPNCHLCDPPSDRRENLQVALHLPTQAAQLVPRELRCKRVESESEAEAEEDNERKLHE